MKLIVRDIILIAMFAALMVVGAKFEIPMKPVPITFQLFFAIFAGLLLGPLKGFISQVIYILLGLVGIPVFADASAGLGYVFKPSFGFLLGFALCAFLCGLFIERIKEITFIKAFIIILPGFFATYIIGTLYMWGILNFNIGKAMSIGGAFKFMIPFGIKDIILTCIIAYTVTFIIPILRKANYAYYRPDKRVIL